VPAGLAVRDWKGTVTSTVEPVLQTPEGGRPLQGPLLIEASDGLLWAGGRFEGPFRLQRDAYGSWTLVEQVPVERYLEGVVPHEIGAGSPMAALQAQTVLARTWALANSHRFSVDGYHLCSDTQCQVYSDPRYAGAAVREAIAATQGKLLSLNNQPISAVYHATNGGVIAAGPEAWAMQPTTYLRAKPDGDEGWSNRHPLPLQQRKAVEALLADRSGAYGQRHPRFRWTRTLSGPALRLALGAAADPLVSPLQLKVLERGVSGRVLTLQISGSSDAAAVNLKLDAIRRTLRTLPSTLFVLEPQGAERWLVVGGGFGHGAGLSQAGAIDLAWRGWPVERILSHYYPGTVYGPLSTPPQSP
jgi:SpoIID/LytB domain protein